jgi:hypothetical protein
MKLHKLNKKLPNTYYKPGTLPGSLHKEENEVASLYLCIAFICYDFIIILMVALQTLFNVSVHCLIWILYLNKYAYKILYFHPCVSTHILHPSLTLLRCSLVWIIFDQTIIQIPFSENSPPPTFVLKLCNYWDIAQWYSYLPSMCNSPGLIPSTTNVIITITIIINKQIKIKPLYYNWLAWEWTLNPR